MHISQLHVNYVECELCPQTHSGMLHASFCYACLNTCTHACTTDLPFSMASSASFILSSILIRCVMALRTSSYTLCVACCRAWARYLHDMCVWVRCLPKYCLLRADICCCIVPPTGEVCGGTSWHGTLLVHSLQTSQTHMLRLASMRSAAVGHIAPRTSI